MLSSCPALCRASTSFQPLKVAKTWMAGTKPGHDGVTNEETNVGLFERRTCGRDLGPLRWLADRRGLLSGGYLRLGPRLLWPNRLSRRAASAARLAGLADFVGDDILLFVRRCYRRLCQRGGARVRSAQLPARRRICDGGGRRLDRPGRRAMAAICR